MRDLDSTPEFVAGIYETMARNLKVVRRRLARPLTLADKILLSHLDRPEEQELIVEKSYLQVRPDRLILQDALGQLVMLQLLATDAKSREGRFGLEPHRLDHLKERRFEAVASYMRSIRETCCPPGDPEWADRAGEAWRLDSTFALAAFEVYLAGESNDTAALAAWMLKDGLSLRDRAYIEAELKQRFEPVTVRGQLQLWERALRLAPGDLPAGVRRPSPADRVQPRVVADGAGRQPGPRPDADRRSRPPGRRRMAR